MDQTAPSADAARTRGAVRSRVAVEAYLLLAFTMLCWGANSVAARLAVGQLSPMVVVCFRWAIVAAVLSVAMRRQLPAAWPQLRRRWLQVVFMALAGFSVFNALYYVAAHHATAVNMSILQGAVPVLVVIGAFFLHRTPVGLLQIGGIAATLIGVAVVATGGHLATLAAFRLNVGDVMMLIACVLYAGYTLGLRNRPAVSGLVFFTAMAMVSFVSSVPMLGAEVLGGTVQWPTVEGWLVLAFIVIFPSFLSQLAFMRAVHLIGPGRAGLFINLVPLVGAFLAVALLGEPLAPYHLIALALIIGGILVAEVSGRRRAG